MPRAYLVVIWGSSVVHLGVIWAPQSLYVGPDRGPHYLNFFLRHSHQVSSALLEVTVWTSPTYKEIIVGGGEYVYDIS